VLLGQLDNAIPTLGSADHATQGGQRLGGKIARRHAVGRDHEIGDDVLGAVAGFHGHLADFIAGEYRFCLQGFETQRPVDLAEVFHPLRRLVLQPQILGQPGHRGEGLWHRAIAVQPGRHAVIGQLGLIADPRPVNVGVCERAVAADHHLDNERQAILVGAERGHVGRKLFGNHGEDRGRGVDGGRITARVLIDGRTAANDRVDVGHGHQNLHFVLRQRLGHGELVQVAGVVVVDRRP